MIRIRRWSTISINHLRLWCGSQCPAYEELACLRFPLWRRTPHCKTWLLFQYHELPMCGTPRICSSDRVPHPHWFRLVRPSLLIWPSLPTSTQPLALQTLQHTHSQSHNPSFSSWNGQVQRLETTPKLLYSRYHANWGTGHSQYPCYHCTLQAGIRRHRVLHRPWWLESRSRLYWNRHNVVYSTRLPK